MVDSAYGEEMTDALREKENTGAQTGTPLKRRKISKAKEERIGGWLKQPTDQQESGDSE